MKGVFRENVLMKRVLIKRVFMKGVVMFMIAITSTAIAQDRLVVAGKKVVESLSADQKKKAVMAGTDEERMNWNFVPTTRRGLSFGGVE